MSHGLSSQEGLSSAVPSLCDVSVSNNPFVPLLCDNRSAILCLSLKMRSPKETVNQVVLFCCDPPAPVQCG